MQSQCRGAAWSDWLAADDTFLVLGTELITMNRKVINH